MYNNKYNNGGSNPYSSVRDLKKDQRLERKAFRQQGRLERKEERLQNRLNNVQDRQNSLTNYQSNARVNTTQPMSGMQGMSQQPMAPQPFSAANNTTAGFSRTTPEYQASTQDRDLMRTNVGYAPQRQSTMSNPSTQQLNYSGNNNFSFSGGNQAGQGNLITGRQVTGNSNLLNPTSVNIPNSSLNTSGVKNPTPQELEEYRRKNNLQGLSDEDTLAWMYPSNRKGGKIHYFDNRDGYQDGGSLDWQFEGQYPTVGDLTYYKRGGTLDLPEDLFNVVTPDVLISLYNYYK